MLILLPPSETKTRPANGVPGPQATDSARLYEGLTQPREELAATIAQALSDPEGASALKIPASRPELADAMRNLAEEPLAPALDVYAGVLYDALDAATIPDSGDVRVGVTSAMYGYVSEADLIPAYRVSCSSKVAGIGTVGTWWKRYLKAIMPEIVGDDLVLDCRSGGYRTMMPTPAERTLEVGAVKESGGKRTVISHDAKMYRGVVARACLLHPEATGSVADLVAMLQREVTQDPRDGGPVSVEHTEGTITVVARK
ncbi:YaaA family protein [Dermabacteraceae bacterium P13088]